MVIEDHNVRSRAASYRQEHMKGRSVHLELLKNKVNCIDIS